MSKIAQAVAAPPHESWRLLVDETIVPKGTSFKTHTRYVVLSGDTVIADVRDLGPETLRHARQMAAAPDLVAALYGAVKQIKSLLAINAAQNVSMETTWEQYVERVPEMQQILAALSKAGEGK